MSTVAVGTQVDEFGFEVTAGKVREFATAIKDPADRYRDLRVAQREGFEAIPAPLTYSVVVGHDRDQRAAMRVLGLDIDRVVVGDVEWSYARPLCVGDRLAGRRSVVDVRQKEGARGGSMILVTLHTEFRDAAGEVALQVREVLIETAAPKEER